MPNLLRMPAIAAGAETAILSEWQVQEGIPFEQSTPIATVETDKAVVEIEAEEAGVILRFLVSPGETVQVDAAIALSAESGEHIDDIDAALRDLGVSPPSVIDTVDSAPPPNSRSSEVASPAASAEATGGRRTFATPLVRQLARSIGLDLATIPGSGPNGRVMRRDIETVLAASSSGTVADVKPTASPPERLETAPQTDADAGFTDTPHSRVRSAIAARLTDSKRSAPHFYLRGSCRVDKLLAFRTELNAHLEKYGAASVSINDLIVKAAACAHTLVPAMNVIWTEHATRRFDAVDIAVAVASPRGLITPVVCDAAGRRITAIAEDVRDLAVRAREGRLAQHEIEGGSLCISNLGMYGTEEFSAIINPPQSAILAVGAARSEPVVNDGTLAIATVMRVTLSVDHRPIDGVTAAEWMAAFIDIVENPLQIVL